MELYSAVLCQENMLVSQANKPHITPTTESPRGHTLAVANPQLPQRGLAGEQFPYEMLAHVWHKADQMRTKIQMADLLVVKVFHITWMDRCCLIFFVLLMA